jgi:hypothetical protein
MWKTSGMKKEVVHVCEPEAGRNLSDDEEKRSLEDLRDCQEGSEEFSICQEGNKKRSQDDLKDCQEGRTENSGCQEGNEMRSLEDLRDCQEGREEIPNCQVGRGKEVRLSESLRELRSEFMSAGSVDGDGID